MNTTLPKALNEKPNTENTPMNQQQMKQEKSEISNQTKQCLIALYCTADAIRCLREVAYRSVGGTFIALHCTRYAVTPLIDLAYRR